MFSILLSIGQVCFAFVFFSFPFFFKDLKECIQLKKHDIPKVTPQKKLDLSLLHIIIILSYIVLVGCVLAI